MAKFTPYSVLSIAFATPVLSTTALVFLGVCALAFYRRMLPKPLPGIPLNLEARNQIFGDIPARKAWFKSHGELRKWYQDQFLKHNSPIVQVFINPLNGEPSVLVCDHKETRDILLRRHKEFDRGAREKQAFGALLPQQFLSIQTPTAKFKFHKELMKDLMLPGFLQDVNAPEIYQKTMNLVQLWRLKSAIAADRCFDAKSDIGRAAFDIIMAVAFGLRDQDSATCRQILVTSNEFSADSANTTTSESDSPHPFQTVSLDAEGQALLDLTDSIHIGITSTLPYLYSWIALRRPPLSYAVKTKEAMMARHIEAAVAKLPATDEEAHRSAGTALEYLVFRERAMARKAGRKPNYHGRYIYDELLGYLIGGNDTTSNTLAWGLIYLADHPAVQTNLRARLSTAFSSPDDDSDNDNVRSSLRATSKSKEPPTYAQIQNTSIPYLSAVIEEIMRLSIVIPVLSRRATCDTTVLGHHIPCGTEVEFIFNGPGFLKPGFEVQNELRTGAAKAGPVGDWDPRDVGEFKPERWLETTKTEKGQAEGKQVGEGKEQEEEEVFNALAGPMLTFGGGPRGCYGKRLAYMEMRILLVLLVWHFEFLPFHNNHARSEKDAKMSSGRRDPGIVENITTEPGECLVRLKTLV